MERRGRRPLLREREKKEGASVTKDGKGTREVRTQRTRWRRHTKGAINNCVTAFISCFTQIMPNFACVIFHLLLLALNFFHSCEFNNSFFLFLSLSVSSLHSSSVLYVVASVDFSFHSIFACFRLLVLAVVY